MDPNTVLAELREWVRQMNEPGAPIPDDSRAAELFESLDEWLSGGGFKPADWACASR